MQIYTEILTYIYITYRKTTLRVASSTKLAPQRFWVQMYVVEIPKPRLELVFLVTNAEESDSNDSGEHMEDDDEDALDSTELWEEITAANLFLGDRVATARRREVELLIKDNDAGDGNDNDEDSETRP